MSYCIDEYTAEQSGIYKGCKLFSWDCTLLNGVSEGQSCFLNPYSESFLLSYILNICPK